MVRNAAWRRSLLCVLALSLGFASPPCKARIYTNHWAVRIGGGPDVAERIAEKYGYRNMGQVSRLLHQKLPLVCVSLFSCFLSTLKRGTRHGGNDSFTSRQIIRGQRAEVQTRAMNLLWDSLTQECFVRQFSQRRRGKLSCRGQIKTTKSRMAQQVPPRWSRSVCSHTELTATACSHVLGPFWHTSETACAV